MGEQAELVVPAQVLEPLADRYWLFPFSKTVEARGRPNKLVRLPLAPRPAPRRQLESAAELLGHPIPDWVVALWSCNINLGMLAYQEAGQLGKYIVEVDRAAHAAGAPRSIVFFAGDAELYPGTQRSSGRGRGTEFFKGELAGIVYGLEPSAGIEDRPPQLIEYRHKVADPEQRLQRIELAGYLSECAREASLADDSDVYSRETYAGIVALREARRPAFRLLWETTTPGLARPDSIPDPGPVRVSHKTYGIGTVVARTGEGAAAKLTIEFADGKKVVLASFVQPSD